MSEQLSRRPHGNLTRGGESVGPGLQRAGTPHSPTGISVSFSLQIQLLLKETGVFVSGEEGLGLFGDAVAQSCSNRVGFDHLDLLGVALRSQL